MIPKIKFKVAKIEDYVNEIVYFLDTDQKEILFKAYPFLKELLNNSKDIKGGIIRFFKEKEKKCSERMKQSQKRFQKEWNKINNSVMKNLEEVNETKWNKKFKTFTARVTLNPICPRFLETNTFDLFFVFPNELMKKVAVHEISHFIFFKKFKEIYPNTNPKNFEYPHIIWNLSEMVPLMILGDKRFQKVLKHEPSVYSVYKRLNINGKNVLSILQEFYNKKKNFEDFIRKSYDFMKKHEKEIKTKFEKI